MSEGFLRMIIDFLGNFRSTVLLVSFASGFVSLPCITPSSAELEMFFRHKKSGAIRHFFGSRGSLINLLTGNIKTKKQPPYWVAAFFRDVTIQVSSAPLSLTSVFGMGTGGPSTSSTPTVQLSVVPDDFVIIARCFLNVNKITKKEIYNL